MFRKFAAAERAVFIALLTFVAATSPVFAQQPESASAQQAAAPAPAPAPAQDAGPRLREPMPRVDASFKDAPARRKDHQTTITISTIVLVLAVIILVIVLVK